MSNESNTTLTPATAEQVAPSERPVFSDATKTMRANPYMTYGQAVGYGAGIAAKALGDKFAGLSRKEWDTATDDYAQGYRRAYIK